MEAIGAAVLRTPDIAREDGKAIAHAKLAEALTSPCDCARAIFIRTMP